jgi:uncharacterized protein (TIGR03435 family)
MKTCHLCLKRFASCFAVLCFCTLSSAPSCQQNARGQTETASVAGQPAKRMEFDTVSIHNSNPTGPKYIRWTTPDGYAAHNFALFSTIVTAYLPKSRWTNHLGADTMLGAPDWVKTRRFDIDAKVASENAVAWQQQGPEKSLLQSALQKMLAERCNLTVEATTTMLPAYALVVVSRSSNLANASPQDETQSGAVRLANGGSLVPYGNDTEKIVHYLDISMEAFASELSSIADRPVIDKTGLSGHYSFPLRKIEALDEEINDPKPGIDWDLRSIGLKLTPVELPFSAVKITHIELPTPN